VLDAPRRTPTAHSAPASAARSSSSSSSSGILILRPAAPLARVCVFSAAVPTTPGLPGLPGPMWQPPPAPSRWTSLQTAKMAGRRARRVSGSTGSRWAHIRTSLWQVPARPGHRHALTPPSGSLVAARSPRSPRSHAAPAGLSVPHSRRRRREGKRTEERIELMSKRKQDSHGRETGGTPAGTPPGHRQDTASARNENPGASQTPNGSVADTGRRRTGKAIFRGQGQARLTMAGGRPQGWP
jgi:hypothetical protein